MRELGEFVVMHYNVPAKNNQTAVGVVGGFINFYFEHRFSVVVVFVSVLGVCVCVCMS